MKSIVIFVVILWYIPTFGQQFKEVKKVVTIPQKNQTYFGRSVAIEKNCAIVGTWVNTSLNYSGFVHLYEWDSLKGWSFKQRIEPIDTIKKDQFGFSVAISGEYAIVGSPYKYAGPKLGWTVLDSGSVYFFKRTKAGQWVQTQKIWEPYPPIKFGYFGASVGISGNYAIVGYKGDDKDVSGGNGISRTGSIYIYKLDNSGVWNQIQKVTPNDRLLFGVFGTTVSISGDVFLASASDRKKSDVSMESGFTNNVYVFKLDSNGFWNQIQKISSPDRLKDEFDAFGSSLSISLDQAIIGAEYSNEIAGAAYIFQRDVSGQLIQMQKIVANDEPPYVAFGGAVAISGKYSVVTAPLQHNFAGCTYVFEKSDSGKWQQIQKFAASDSTNGAKFGFAAGLSRNRMIVGAIWDRKDDKGVNTNKVSAGSAYFFDQILPIKKVEPRQCLPSDVNYIVPNVITPNGDGYNDSFRIENLQDSTSISIYNRYGKPVFTNGNYKNDWNGDGLSSGVYFYLIKQQQKECVYESRGWLSIVR